MKSPRSIFKSFDLLGFQTGLELAAGAVIIVILLRWTSVIG